MCKSCFSRSISKAQSYVLYSFCAVISVLGIALTVYGILWDVNSPDGDTLFSIYNWDWFRYHREQTVYHSILSWSGFLSLIPGLYGMIVILCCKRTTGSAASIAIVSFVSLASQIAATCISGYTLAEVNILRNAKEESRCQIVKDMWSSSSYCECRLNADQQYNKRVARVLGDDCSLIKGMYSLILRIFALSLSICIISSILLYIALLVCCNPQKESSPSGQDDKILSDIPINPPDAPPAYHSITQNRNHDPAQANYYNAAGDLSYVTYSAQQPTGTGANIGPSAPPVRDYHSDGDEKTRLLYH